MTSHGIGRHYVFMHIFEYFYLSDIFYFSTALNEIIISSNKFEFSLLLFCFRIVIIEQKEVHFQMILIQFLYERKSLIVLLVSIVTIDMVGPRRKLDRSHSANVDNDDEMK